MDLILESLKFPFQKGSAKLMIGLVLLHMVASGLAMLPVISIASLLLIGYIYAIYFNIIYTTGNSYSEAPSFPDFENIFDNVLMPLVKILIVTLITYLPAMIYAWQTACPNDTVYWSLILLGQAYLPIGLMIIALDETSKALNPIQVIQSIRAIGPVYWLLAGSLCGLTHAAWYLEDALPASWIISSFSSSYVLAFGGRMIGSVYRERIARL